MPASIYQITNKCNGDTYIGKTVYSVSKRFYQHVYEALHRNSQSYLHRAIRKYGREAFEWTVLETPDATTLNDRERYWITHLSPAYNLTSGGDGGDTSMTPGYQQGMLRRRSYAGAGNPMYGRKRPPLSQKWKVALNTAARRANRCPVMCDGVRYESVGDAQKAYPGIRVSKRLNSPRYPNFYRLRPRTLRPRQSTS